MFSGVYDHSVVIAFAAVRAMFSLVSTMALFAITGCAVAPRKAPPATNNAAAAAAATFSRLPAVGAEREPVPPPLPRRLRARRPLRRRVHRRWLQRRGLRLRAPRRPPASSPAFSSAGTSVRRCRRLPRHVVGRRRSLGGLILTAPQEVPSTALLGGRLFGGRLFGGRLFGGRLFDGRLLSRRGRHFDGFGRLLHRCRVVDGCGLGRVFLRLGGAELLAARHPMPTTRRRRRRCRSRIRGQIT